MYQMSLKWFGLIMLISSAAIFAASVEGDAGPMPPPDGPFFSSKPLLYFGEEPPITEVNGLAIQNIPTFLEQRPPIGAGYQAPQGAPGYYGRTAPAPLGMGRNMMQRPMPVYPSGWGAQPPYNRYNPNYPGYPPYPARWGTNPR